MTLCPLCGVSTNYVTPEGLCPYHVSSYGDDWAKGNAIWCDFFHRGVVPERLPGTERDDGISYDNTDVE